MKTIIPIATLFLGLAGGYLIGQKSPSPSAETSKGNTNTAISTKSSKGGLADSVDSSSKTGAKRDSSTGNAQFYTGNPIVGKIQSMLSFYSQLDRDELKSEAQKLESMPFSERMVAASLLFSRWGEVAPFDALEFSDKIGFAGRFVRPTILQSWAADDPKGAAKYFEDNPGQFQNQGRGWRAGGNNNAAGAIAGEWAKKDFDAAFAWAGSLSGQDATSATRAIFQETAKTDPQQASQKLSQITDEALRKEATASVAAEWARQNPDQAESWALGLGQAEQDAALARVYGTLSETDAFAAAEKLTQIQDLDAKKEIVGTIANNMSKSEPGEAMNWLSSLDSSVVNPDAVRRPMSSLAATDDVAARAWLESQPNGDLRDSAAITYIYSTRSNDHASNLEIAATIENNRQARRAEGVSLTRWIRENPADAESYMQEAGYEDDRIEQIKKRAKSGRL